MARHLPEFATPEEIAAIKEVPEDKPDAMMNANCGGAIPHNPHAWASGAPGYHKWWCDGKNRTQE